MIAITLQVEERTIQWVHVDDGWDAFVDGQENYDLGALSINGVFSKVASLMDNPEAIKPS